jgi:pimeloyl-ACP methyl ester carboxylesterase
LPIGVSMPPVSAKFAERGERSYSVSPGEFRGPHGCLTTYEVYEPSQIATKTMVFVSHGFMADLSSTRGWAEHWASFGVPVTIMTTCNSTWWNGRHQRNADDIRALAESLHDGSVIYAGHSSGGLAALLATAADPKAVAYLGLDAVDTGGLGVSAAPDVGVPACFIFGEPSSCNARGNFGNVYPLVAESRALKIVNATHCHFENPVRDVCGRICGTVEPIEASDRIAATVRAAATAWILSHTVAEIAGYSEVEMELAARGLAVVVQ